MGENSRNDLAIDGVGNLRGAVFDRDQAQIETKSEIIALGQGWVHGPDENTLDDLSDPSIFQSFGEAVEMDSPFPEASLRGVFREPVPG